MPCTSLLGPANVLGAEKGLVLPSLTTWCIVTCLGACEGRTVSAFTVEPVRCALGLTDVKFDLLICNFGAKYSILNSICMLFIIYVCIQIPISMALDNKSSISSNQWITCFILPPEHFRFCCPSGEERREHVDNCG